MNLPTLEERILSLLQNIGDVGACRGCQAAIYWVTHKNGKKTPYTPAGINHFIDCPARAQFGKAKQSVDIQS